MGRVARVLLAAGVILLLTAVPALSQNNQEPVIDITQFMTISVDWGDRNGDGIPDLPQEGPDQAIPVGIAGIWDDAVGATTPEEFLDAVDPEGITFDLGDTGATLIGPCGGAAISYDANGNSLDAAVDLGDDGPPIDLYGNPALTASNPFTVDSGGVVLYFGFTLDVPTLSEQGALDFDYGDPALAFHDHKWEVTIMEISSDEGGDPNQRDKNRNAGVMDLAEELPFPFQLDFLVKAKGVMVDLWAPQELPEYTADNVATVFAGHEYCFGEGWVEFTGSSYPLFTVPGALATAFAAAGFSGILFNARPAMSWRA
jgi:hypothetical protein